MLKIKDGFNLGIGMILANVAVVMVSEALKSVIPNSKEEPKTEKTEETN